MTGFGPEAAATVILAAGSGRRFGGSKLTQPLGDTTVLEHVLQVAATLRGAHRVVVVGPYRREVDPVLDRHPGLLVVTNPDHELGLATSLRCGLAAVRELGPEVTCAVVLLGDEPGTPPAALRAVLQQASASGRPARASYRGQAGHPVALPRSTWDAVEQGSHGDAGARRVLTDLGVEDVPVDHPRPHDIDDPHDLAAVRRILPAATGSVATTPPTDPGRGHPIPPGTYP